MIKSLKKMVMNHTEIDTNIKLHDTKLFPRANISFIPKKMALVAEIESATNFERSTYNF
jgi:hypothetical protein